MKSHYCQIKLTDNSPTITMVYLPDINLYVISDAKGFGQHWIRVSYCQKIYDTKFFFFHNFKHKIYSFSFLVCHGNEFVGNNNIVLCVCQMSYSNFRKLFSKIC